MQVKQLLLFDEVQKAAKILSQFLTQILSSESLVIHLHQFLNEARQGADL
jgi:hypothetical protein